MRLCDCGGKLESQRLFKHEDKRLGLPGPDHALQRSDVGEMRALQTGRKRDGQRLGGSDRRCCGQSRLAPRKAKWRRNPVSAQGARIDGKRTSGFIGSQRTDGLSLGE